MIVGYQSKTTASSPPIITVEPVGYETKKDDEEAN